MGFGYLDINYEHRNAATVDSFCTKHRIWGGRITKKNNFPFVRTRVPGTPARQTAHVSALTNPSGRNWTTQLSFMRVRSSNGSWTRHQLEKVG